MIFFALLLILNSVAHAQDSVRLEDIEVVGNKEGRTFSETPESVSILPPSRLNRGDQANSLEVLNGQANVQVTRNSENFSIRGVNNEGVTGFQKDNLASVFVDGLFQTDLAMRAGGFEVWDIQSLEIHRGPQSTSQGVNSLAGAILLQHEAPHQDDEAALKLGYGSFNRRELGGVVNHAFLNKKLATRISFNKDLNDGFITNKTTGNSKWGRQDKGHLVVDFKYFFEDKSELRFNNKFLRTNNGGNYTVGSRPRSYDVFEDQDYRTLTNNQQNSLQYQRTLSDKFSSKTTLGYSKGLQHNTLDADATPLPTAGTRREFAHDQFISLENVLNYKSARVKNAFGLHAHQFRSFNNYEFSLLIGATPVAVIQDLEKERSTYALFDSLLYELDAHHSLNLGGRYEYVDNSFGTYVNPLTTTGNATIDNYLNSVRGSYDGKKESGTFLPKLGYLYRSGEHSYGLTYSQGYRIGGIGINRSQAKAVRYDPEHTSNYEASWKHINGQWQSQANVFYTYWRDQQVQVRLAPNDSYNTQIENASTSELYGAELETVRTYEEGDTFRFGVGHVRTRFLSFTNLSTVYTGNEFPDAARWTAQTAYGHFFSDSISSNLTLRYVGKSFTNAENTLKASEQFYLDLNLQYSGKNYVWELNAKNITDQQYMLGKSAVYSNFYQRVSRPRELGTRVTWMW